MRMLPTRQLCLLVLLTTWLQGTLPAAAANPLVWMAHLWQNRQQHPEPPAMSKDLAVEQLAENIDWLETQINRWGSVVAKSPDVWGEARLTKYRQEIELELAEEIDQFDQGRISGAQVVSDQAMLAAALALRGPAGDAAIPTTAVSIDADSVATSRNDAEATMAEIDTQFSPSHAFGIHPNSLNYDGTGIQLEQTEELDQLNRYLHHLAQLRRINEGDDTADAPGYAMNLVRLPVSVLPGTLSKRGHGAELTVTAKPYLGPELLPIAVRDFVINDLVDQLALPLTKFVNKDPAAAKRAFDGLSAYQQVESINADITAGRMCFGAADAETAKLYAEFVRKLGARVPFYVNKQLCVTEIIAADSFHAKDAAAEFAALAQAFQQQGVEIEGKSDQTLRRIAPLASQLKGGLPPAEFNALAASAVRNLRAELARIPEFTPDMVRDDQQTATGTTKLEAVLQQAPPLASAPDGTPSSPDEDRADPDPHLAPLLQHAASGTERLQKLQTQFAQQLAQLEQLEQKKKRAAENAERLSSQSDRLANLIEEITRASEYLDVLQGAAVHFPASSTRRSTLPFPPNQLLDNYGQQELGAVALVAFQAFQADLLNRDVVHVADVQGFLREELSAAYDLMMSDTMRHWWAREASEGRQLHHLIRTRQVAALQDYRDDFMSGFSTAARQAATANLAWCVFVESILLNERLVQDVRDTVGTRPGYGPLPIWLPYFGPTPPEQARRAFADYVRLRWPLRIFTLDPVVTEQNIADVSSIYRQMQMAVAIGFSTGEIGISAAMQAMRRLQRDRATVDLNRVAVGFAHGDDTFGWRFFPRFQTPPVESNLTVLFRDLIIGGPTDRQLERKQEIEPGMRECMAIVLMPSFVPHVTFETRGNWFKIAAPGRTAVSVAETVEHSRAIRSMQRTAQEFVTCPELYRDGEVQRLLARVHQLSQELPLQTLETQVPIENSLGGFEILSHGTRELAPELLGWYGAPGYDPTRPVELFLSGDNFSVHQTRLIVGNANIPFRLLSRQIMQVTLPPNLPVLRDQNLIDSHPEFYDGYLDAHVATPYGVSGHLLIPAVRRPWADGPPRVVLQPQTLTLQATRDGTSVTGIAVKESSSNSLSLAQLMVPSELGLAGLSDVTIAIHPRSGSHRLESVEVEVEAIVQPPGYAVSASETASQLSETTKLYGSLKDYLEHVLGQRTETDTEPANLTIECSATLHYNDLTAPAQGTTRLEIEWSLPPG